MGSIISFPLSKDLPKVEQLENLASILKERAMNFKGSQKEIEHMKHEIYSIKNLIDQLEKEVQSKAS